MGTPRTRLRLLLTKSCSSGALRAELARLRPAVATESDEPSAQPRHGDEAAQDALGSRASTRELEPQVLPVIITCPLNHFDVVLLWERAQHSAPL